MSDKKIATRQGYGEALKELGALHDDIVVLDADLAGSTKSGMFGKEFPERFTNCGIAEANMMDVAAGMSTLGLVPFASSFAMFATGRAYEMIRNTIGYPHLNVKVCASHGGISVGEDGASHQCNEDFALMRNIPGMVVMCPADYVEAKQMTKKAYEYNGPVYMRLGRSNTPVFHDDSFEFEIGKGEILQNGDDVTIIATGIMVPEAMEAGKRLEMEGIHPTIINMATIKPLDQDLVIEQAKKTGNIITVEEHSIVGGLGEAVAACLAENYPTKLKRIGVQDVFGYSGPASDLLNKFGLSSDNIVAVTREMLAR